MAAGAQLVATIERHAVAMRDGVALATDVYRPSDARLPTLLLRTPYDRRDLHARVREVDVPRALEAGFAVALQDLRGRFGSEGEFCANRPDGQDGADAIAWIRRQRWSDGRVAMVGSSYDGCVQFQAARMRPEGLVALAPTVCGALRTIWYPGGALRLRPIAAWIALLLAEALPAAREDSARAEIEALLYATPLERLHAVLEPETLAWRLGAPLRHWISAPASDRFWTEVTAVPPEPLPALHTSGWFDVCLPAAVEAHGAWSAAADSSTPQLLTLGPWEHCLEVVPCPDLGLEAESGPSRAVAWERQLAFLSAMLGRAPIEELAPVRSFVLGRNRWHDDTRWPPSGVRPLELRLAGAVNGTGRLQATASDDPEPARYRYDPRNPSPALAVGHLVETCGEPAEDGRRGARLDGLTFTSGCFDGELELAGAAVARLLVASSAPATDFVARLWLVLPDGRSLLLADGIWSGRLADLPRAAPGVAHRLCEVALGPIHVAIAPGRRVRLQITSSSFPDVYPNPNTGHDLADGLPPRVAIAEQSLLVRDSSLILPVRGPRPREVAA